MKDNGRIVKWMVMVKCSISMVISILDNGRIIGNTVMVKSFIKMEINISDNGNMINVNNEKSFLMMELSILVNMVRITKWMDMDTMLTQTITNT